jgi:pimeloyl-ACP methyl ester carboxylesterase
MSMVVSKFCIYHITAPVQQAGDTPSPSHPSIDQLSEVVEYVCHNYGIPTFVGMGVGLGANVMVRLAARRPKLVDGLILINCDSQKAGWVEWGYHKVNMKNIKKSKTLSMSYSLQYL